MNPDLEYALIVIGFSLLIPVSAWLAWLAGRDENGPRSGDGDTGR